MNLRRQLVACITGTIALTIVVVVFTVTFADNGWFSFGPSDNLVIAGVKIDSTSKYAVLVSVIVVNSVIDMVVSEFASPIIGFNVYNPDKTVITDFASKRELQVMTALFWGANNLRGIFTVLISITQFDLALIKWFVLELTAIYTVGTILSKKTFRRPSDQQSDTTSLLDEDDLDL
jgi:hypothetical protein